jgi:hypothetical protein
MPALICRPSTLSRARLPGNGPASGVAGGPHFVQYVAIPLARPGAAWSGRAVHPRKH